MYWPWEIPPKTRPTGPGLLLLRGFASLVVGVAFAGHLDAQDPNLLPEPESAPISYPGLITAPEERLAVGDEYEVPSGSAVCERTLKANVVALDKEIFYNRLMVRNPASMIYALRRDVIARNLNPADRELRPGAVDLRPDKRPRPLVLRMNVGDCLRISFQNLLSPMRVDGNQPNTRTVGMHIEGLSLVESMISSGSNVGAIDPSNNGLAAPGEYRTYVWYASKPGPFLIQAAGAFIGGEGDGGQSSHDLFGVVNIEPRGSIYYRSQVTAEELRYATRAIDPSTGLPIIHYSANYPNGHAFAGKPVLRILDGPPGGTEFEIFHSDLNAIIVPPEGSYPPVTAAAPDNGAPDSDIVVRRNRDEPFREFTIVYHDEQALLQAFPVLEEEFFAHSIRDNMAINYGTGGIGAEIISYGGKNVGPNPSPHIPAGMARNCNDCKYEEAFLSSWAVGDPAMIFERDPPTNLTDPPATGKAVRALYPDDPSNVHHSYLNDHVKMRVLHGGVSEHHIHHLHAHQWLHQQNSDNSSYFDSQAIGPGSAFTLDITYNGSGNRNKTVGDSIFHCHFYPHFAQGMWELWRVHDVFEDGQRTLPDVELENGSPIPALVPLPHLAMPPTPTVAMPGFPFYIPGEPGHRPPHPPLDTIHDGGLPRHVVLDGTVEDGNRGPFDRIQFETVARELPEAGTPLELAAMNFHSQRLHQTMKPDGTTADAWFVTNGRPAAPGAPYADPCVDDNGFPVGLDYQGEPLRKYKSAVVQITAFFNKAKWHFNQWRMLSLWEDVGDLVAMKKPPEPFFFRANSGECIEYLHTNLVPSFYNIDDFQIFTPTDVIGQHIHLVKFDVTSSDGAGNGWNYEDGTFAPEEVIERIDAINRVGGLYSLGGGQTLLTPEEHPFFAGVEGVHSLGAQTTVQRWWADPLLNAAGEDRTVRTVFTHDHFGPSTHQQAGLYAGLLVEPADSIWRHPESGAILGNRSDGGPTSWRADILTTDIAESFREFAIEHQDFHLAYDERGEPVNPPGRIEVGLPHIVEPPPVPMPEGVSADDVGTMSVNYRNEPIALRISQDVPGGDPIQDPNPGGDLVNVYRSNVPRARSEFNSQPGFYDTPLTAGVAPGDPFTPLLRLYEGDPVQIRTLQGATEEGHNFDINGVRWLREPDDPKSGYRNNQMNGISEHHEFEFVAPEVEEDATTRDEYGRAFADFLYRPGMSVDDQWNGNWGIMREYEGLRPDLLPLPNNPDGELPEVNRYAFRNQRLTCPRTAPVRRFDVTAVRAADVLPGGTLVYNSGHRLNDPEALIYVPTRNLLFDSSVNPPTVRWNSAARVEPLILRARAGDCIRLTLRNGFRDDPLDSDAWNLWPMIMVHFNANQVVPSNQVGIHPQLVQHDVRANNGINVGFNPVNTVSPGNNVTYEWYAGKIDVQPDGSVVATPVEFGATNLMPADPMKHTAKGLIGALIIEPQNSRWTLPPSTELGRPPSRAIADITTADGRTYREFVMVFQDDVQLRLDDGTPVLPVGSAGGEGEPGEPPGPPGPEDPEDSANKAINYRTETLWTRVPGYTPGMDFNAVNDLIHDQSLNSISSGPIETPLYWAKAGTPVRFRALMPGGHPRNNVITIHGHLWRHETSNPQGDFIGSQAGHGPGNHFDIIPLHGAGGAFGLAGDYLYRTHAATVMDGGIWGIFRVTD